MSWLPKSSRRIRREAADWVARRKGNPQAAAEDDFQRWYRESDRQAEAYDRMAAIWELSGRTSAPAGRDFVNDNARSVAGRVAIAASLLAILVAGALALMAGRSAGTEPGPLLLASTIGEVAPYRLADGSQVVLDTASRVEVRYSPTRRQLVLLTGRARFTVADGCALARCDRAGARQARFCAYRELRNPDARRPAVTNGALDRRPPLGARDSPEPSSVRCCCPDELQNERAQE